MLLGSKAPTLSVTVSIAPNFITNENVFRIQQWFDESSNEGLRVNNSRVLLVADSEVDSGMLNFIRTELSVKSMPSQIAAVLLHREQAASSDAMEIVSAMDTPSNSRVYYPWNSDVSYSQHETKVIDTQPKETEQPEEGYWDWPAEDPLNVSQIEKHLTSDSKRRQKESEQKVSHSEPEVQSYWDWEVKEPTPADVLKDIMEYEKIRPTFTIEHIEETLVNTQEQEDVYEHRSTKNIFLGNNSEYWAWDSEAVDNEEETLLPNIMEEDRIQKILSIEHTEQQLKDNSSNEESKTSDDSPYWSWMSSNIYAESQLEEYLERVDKDATPHEEEKTEVHAVDVDVEKEIIAIRNAMDPTELLQWVLDSCQLGLIPSADILRKLLLSHQQQEEIYQPVVELSDQKLSAHESQSYWDESPTTNEHKTESYWDERPVNTVDANNYWDESPNVAKYNTSYLDEAPTNYNKEAAKENSESISNDNDRASVAAFYLTMLNKDAAVTPAPTNEDEERASIAAFYRNQVHVPVAPTVEKEVIKASVNNDSADYWDEQCSNHDMEEDDLESYWD